MLSCAFELDRAHDLPQLCVQRPLAPRLHQPRQLHGDRRAAGHDVAGGDKLNAARPSASGSTPGCGVEAAVLIGQQQFEIGRIDAGFRIGRQPPAAVGHGIGTQQFSVTVDNGCGDLAGLLQRQWSERGYPRREGAHHDDEGDEPTIAAAFLRCRRQRPSGTAARYGRSIAHFAARTSTVPVPERP